MLSIIYIVGYNLNTENTKKGLFYSIIIKTVTIPAIL